MQKTKFIAVLLFFIPFYINAKVLHVTSAEDNKTNPVDGMLRHCITNASKADTIVFDVDSVGLVAELLIANKSLTIDGGTGTIIDGGKNGRVFNISLSSTDELIIKNITIQNGYINDASFAWGGGMYAFTSNDGLKVENCIFKNNTSNTEGDGQGGALRTQGGIFTNCFFLNNSVTGTGFSNSGGAVMSVDGKFINCVFAGNSAKYGGGIYSTNKSEFTNCTITQNKAEATGNGAGISCEEESLYTNCIVYNNKSATIEDNIVNNGGNFKYSAFELGNSLVGTNGNIGLSTTPFTHSTNKDSLSLSNNSGCIDKGDFNTQNILEYDISGKIRISGIRVDIGAYEYTITPKVVTRSDDSLTPVEGMLRYAIDNASDGDVITFSVDTIYADTTFTFGTKSLVISGKDNGNVTIKGNHSFLLFRIAVPYEPNTENIKVQRFENLTFQLGGGNCGAIYGVFQMHTTFNHCSFINNKGQYCGAGDITGGTISNCYFSNNEPVGIYAGYGALRASYSKIINCEFIENKASLDKQGNAGALLIYNSTVSNSKFINNYANGIQAVGAVNATNSIFSNCLFYQNSVNPDKSSRAGAANSSNSKFINCTFKENKGAQLNSEWGIYPPYISGAVYTTGGDFINCLFTGNNSYCNGALYSNGDNPVNIINCTFTRNKSSYRVPEEVSGAFYIRGDSKAVVKNSISYENYPNNYFNNNTQSVISNCAIQDTLVAGNANIKLNSSPFESSLAEDYYFLKQGSICINSGDTVDVSNFLPITDLVGNNRINNDAIDIGAIEYVQRNEPTITWPTVNLISYGESLGKAINKNGQANMMGYFIYDSTRYLDAGSHKVEILFTPTENNITDYKSVTDSISVQVNKASLFVIAKDTSVKYGDAEPIYKLQYSGFVLNQDTAVIDTKPYAYVNNYQNTNAGINSGIINITGGADNNYDFNYTNGSLTIEKKQILVTAKDTSIKYGSEEPNIELLYSGFVFNQDPTVLDTKPIAFITDYQNFNAGNYPDAIQITNGVDDNYDFDYNYGSLNIEKASILVTAKDTSVKYGSPEPTYKLLYSGFVFNQDTSVIDTKPVAFVNNYSTLTEGVYPDIIQITGGNDNNYNFDYNPGTLTITTPLSTNETTLQNILVYPNPVKEKLFLKNFTVRLNYRLSNVFGGIIEQGILEPNFPAIDFNQYPSGVYILLIETKNISRQFKIIKN